MAENRYKNSWSGHPDQATYADNRGQIPETQQHTHDIRLLSLQETLVQYQSATTEDNGDTPGDAYKLLTHGEHTKIHRGCSMISHLIKTKIGYWFHLQRHDLVKNVTVDKCPGTKLAGIQLTLIRR